MKKLRYLVLIFSTFLGVGCEKEGGVDWVFPS